MLALAEFQNNFARALLDPNTMLRHQYGVGLAVYQNTVMKGLVDVLRANYPTVERLVGAEWFNSIALLYARKQLPEQPALALYGASFPDFLDGPAAEQGLSYLPSVAHLDRVWTEAHFAADADVLSAVSLQSIAPQQLHKVKLQWHPATRAAWRPHSSVFIWQSNRPPALPIEELEVDDTEQGMLLTRPTGAILTMRIQRADYDFLQQLRSGKTLGEAAIAVLEQHPDADIAAMLARTIEAGAFAAAFEFDSPTATKTGT